MLCLQACLQKTWQGKGLEQIVTHKKSEPPRLLSYYSEKSSKKNSNTAGNRGPSQIKGARESSDIAALGGMRKVFGQD